MDPTDAAQDLEVAEVDQDYVLIKASAGPLGACMHVCRMLHCPMFEACG